MPSSATPIRPDQDMHALRASPALERLGWIVLFVWLLIVMVGSGAGCYATWVGPAIVIVGLTMLLLYPISLGVAIAARAEARRRGQYSGHLVTLAVIELVLAIVLGVGGLIGLIISTIGCGMSGDNLW